METKANDYQLRQGSMIYVLSTSLIENGIKLSVKNQLGKKYSKEFTIYELKSVDPIFNEIKSENDAILFFDKALNVHKVGVREESGIIKIIFYVTTKGVMNAVEISLGEDGKSILQAQLDNLNANNSLAIKQAVGNGEQVEMASPVYENGNSAENANSYGQQSYNLPTITPVEDEGTANYTTNQYMSQYQTSGTTEYQTSGTTEYQTSGTTQYETSGTTQYGNSADIGSYIQQDTNTNQYSYENASSGFGTNVNYASPNELNSYQYTSNQYSLSTDNNYYPSSNYSNYSNYQTTGTSYETNSYNIPSNYNYSTDQYNTSTNYNYTTTDQYNTSTNYNYTTDQYNNASTNYNYSTTQYTQPSIETASDTQSYQTYETTAKVKTLYNNSLPTITPVEPEETTHISSPMSPVLTTNKYEIKKTFISSPVGTGTTRYQTHTSPYVSSSYHLPVNQTYKTQYETNTNIISSQPTPQTSKAPTITDNQSVQQRSTTTTTTTKRNIITTNQNIASPKPQLTNVDPFKKQIDEIADLKKQLLELNSLKAKLAEFNAVKAQLGELNNLKEQVGQMNVIKKQMDELKTMRTEVSSNEVLKKKLEELEKTKLEYENEIKKLREKPSLSGTFLVRGSQSKVIKTKGLDSKQLTFEDRPQQIAVKGEIIHDTDELELIIRKINKLNKKLTLNLLYKATADSDKAEAFHEKCDGARKTIVLVETDKGRRFGGYTSCSWSGENVEKKDEDAFVFSLDKMKIYENISGEDAIGCYPKFGPIFLGCQIRIYDSFFTKGGTTFEKGLNYNTEEDYELNDGEREYKVKEIEVYEVIAQ